MELFVPGDKFSFQLVDAVTLEGVADETFGAVVSRSFFEHLLIEDAVSHVRHVHRVLKRGGDLILECPAGVGPPSDITRSFPEYDSPAGLHIKEYRIGEITDILVNAGFGSIRSILLRSRIMSYLPLSMQQHNVVSPRFVAALERCAQSTWQKMQKSHMRREVWKQFWGHLGAISIRVVARKP
jgi:hypothetical protein